MTIERKILSKDRRIVLPQNSASNLAGKEIEIISLDNGTIIISEVKNGETSGN